MKTLCVLIVFFVKFYGYKEFANDIMKNTNFWKGDEESLNEGIRNYISRNFDNTILIIDEAHNISGNEYGEALKKIIKNCCLRFIGG